MIALILMAAATPQLACYDSGTQMELTQCAGQDFAQADAAMTRQWNLTVKTMKKWDADFDRTYDKRPGYFQTLLDGQRAWLRYRDLHCTSEGFGARGGSMEPMLYQMCRAELTRQRTKKIAQLIETN
jgi:uncharacterized protein YecT (DUF1311 family)